MILRQPNTKEEICFIAKMIYQSDGYIYPNLFGNEETAQAVLTELKKEAGYLFSEEQLLVGIEKGRLRGGMCWYKYSPSVSMEIWKKIFENYNLPLPKHFEFVFENYIEKLAEESLAGIYISNFCIEKSQRGQGWGTTMLAEFCDQYREQNIYLDVLAENTAAVRLYEKLNFRCIDQFPGFSIEVERPLCLRMKREMIL